MPTVTFTQEYTVSEPRITLRPGVALADILIPKGSVIRAERDPQETATILIATPSEKKARTSSHNIGQGDLDFSRKHCRTPREFLIDLYWRNGLHSDVLSMLKNPEEITMTVTGEK
mgnify:CR=1 FL=1